MRDDIDKLIPFYQYLSESEISQLNNHISIHKYKKGDNVYSPIRECLGFLLVISGKLRTYILSDEGREVTLFWTDANDSCILSVSCLLKQITFDVFIDAVFDSEVLIINTSYFQKLMKDNIYIENYSLKLTNDKFSKVMFSMQQLLFYSLDKRFAIYLVNEIKNSNNFTIFKTHEEIARDMSTSREVITRIIKHFVEDNIISTKRGSITIIDSEHLKSIIK